MIASVNPAIIRWGRERSGWSLEDLAESMNRSPDQIEAWEAGKDFPSYSTLEDLAERYFKIPLAVFFFPEPPDVDEPVNRFRRLPDYELDRLSPDTRHSIRIAQGFQDSLVELLEEDVPDRCIFRDLSIDKEDLLSAASSVREFIGVSLKQQATIDKMDSMFKVWRHALEEIGIYTFKGSLKDKFISGFSLLDDSYPIIFINNSNAFSRQIFTLFHELAHILVGIHGVTDADEAYFDQMSGSERTLEIACNRFAAEVLVPSGTFEKDLAYYNAMGDDAIAEIAGTYSVSREVILRRLLDQDVITQEHYQSLSTTWNADYLRSRSERSGGNYYNTNMSYLGEGFMRLAFSQKAKGRITTAELAGHLNMKSSSVAGLQSRLGW